jgi:hypothetical protein
MTRRKRRVIAFLIKCGQSFARSGYCQIEVKETNMRIPVQHILLSCAALGLAALACQAVGGQPTPAPLLPTDPPPPTDPPAPELLYQDDFEDPNSGWVSQRDDDGITDYEQGGYRIRIDLPDWFFWVQSGGTYSDVRIDVDVTKLGGPDENEFGLICRYVDADNFYFFTASNDGYYGVTKVVGGEYELIGMSELQPSSAISTGAASNHLQVTCNGDELRFVANGSLLADVRDATFTSGDVGLIAGTAETAGTDVLFDNLVVVSP